MKTAARRYIGFIILLGALLLPYCIYRYGLSLGQGDLVIQLMQMSCLVVICSVCRSMPVYFSPHHAIDVSILATVTAVLLSGPYAAVVMYILSSFLTIEVDTATRKKTTLYNTSVTKSAFNNANLLLSILIPGLIIELMGHVPGDVRLPWVLVPMLVFTVLSFLLNSATLLVMFHLNGDMTPHDAMNVIKGMVPNVIAAMPMGLLTCFVFTQQGGYWVALIMLLPLMLARHAWKLYLDSRSQHLNLIQAFVAAVEAKDKYTEGHSRRVSRYAGMIAAEMSLRPSQVEDIRVAALLHDIGKIGIRDAVLLKPTRLDDDEYGQIRQHPQIGVHILGQVNFQESVIDMVLHHHERMDGRGYPDKLIGDQLSQGARIMAVADAFDAMTSERPYRKGMQKELAFAQLREGRGTQFDAQVVDAFIRVLHKSEWTGAMAS